jgi:hypothetical protein
VFFSFRVCGLPLFPGDCMLCAALLL